MDFKVKRITNRQTNGWTDPLTILSISIFSNLTIQLGKNAARNYNQSLFFIKLVRFAHDRDTYFDVTADDAIEVILKDTKKEKNARDEDAEFVRRLRRNDFVAFGGRDWEQEGRFNRASERAENQKAQVERELKRKRVRAVPQMIGRQIGKHIGRQIGKHIGRQIGRQIASH